MKRNKELEEKRYLKALHQKENQLRQKEYYKQQTTKTTTNSTTTNTIIFIHPKSTITTQQENIAHTQPPKALFTPKRQKKKDFHTDKNPLSWKKYFKLVWEITRKQNLKSRPGYTTRSIHGYQLDHKVSVWEGWKRGFPPQWIGSYSNLRIVTKEVNMRKGRSSLPKDLNEMLKRQNVNQIYKDNTLNE